MRISRPLAVTALVIAMPLAILGILHVRNRFALCEAYDEARLVGLSAKDVKARLGTPQFNTESDHTWVYQPGMNPEAFVRFQNGRVADVQFLLWQCPPFSWAH